MSEFLEAAMLICFGFSWPINLIKNIRSNSAKGMSLQFILLIIAGYIAGITAKIITHRINYVLAVYFFNLAVVSCNLIVYFRNHRIDCAGTMPENNTLCTEDTSMTDAGCRERTHTEKLFAEMNEVAPRNSVVFFGSNHFAELPVAELAKSFHLEENLCNRSVPDATIDDITPMLDVCVLNLNPGKVFVNLGDADIESPAFDIESFLSAYEWLLYTIHTKTKARIFVVSLASSTAIAKQINDRLRVLAENDGCDFVDISDACSSPRPDLRIFSTLKHYMRSCPMDFCSAMSAATV